MTTDATLRDPVGAARAAATQADLAAASSRVRVRELTDLVALRDVAGVYRTVWHSDARTAPVSPDLLRALSHAGGYVAGAYDRGRLVGASMGFHTGSAETGLHSHISAVLPDVQGRDIGRALKLHQRSWALEHGLRTITWTYDPLLRRNAWFNLTKLGARAVGYLVDFYGVMDDAQNEGDESDRAVALWSLEAPHVVEAASGRRTETTADQMLRGGACLGLASVDGVPVPAVVPDRAPCVLVQVPADLQALRAADPALARRWRETSRAVLEPLLAGPYVATGFTRSGHYVLEEVSE